MNGFLVIDKTKGISSFDVVRLLRRVVGVKKIGHCGTLDPMATGVLVVAVGEATKLIEYLLGADKRYVAEVRLGAVSDTFDAEGEVEEVRGGEGRPDLDEVKRVLEGKFLGEIEQVPPKFSALKVSGKRAYELAREGKAVEMKGRKVRIEAIEVVSYEWPKLVIDVKCGKGTYIRSLANDLGEALGCGGYLSGLRRVEVGRFGIDEAHEIMFRNEGRRLEPVTGLEEVKKWLLGLEVGVEGMARIEVNDEEERDLRFGKFLEDRWSVGMVGAAFCGERLVGLVEKRGDKVKLKKGINEG